MVPKINLRWILIGIVIVLTTLYVNAIIDTNPNNNIMNISVNVVETNDITVLYVPIDDDSDFDETFSKASLFFESTYPGKVVSLRGKLVNSSSLIDNKSANGRSQLMQILQNLEQSSDISNIDYTVAIAPENFLASFGPDFDVLGIYFPSIPKAVFAKVNTLGTSMHEVLHSLRFCDERSQDEWRGQDIRFNISGFVIRGRCLNGDFNPNDDFLDSVCIPQGCPASTLQPIYPFGDLPQTGLSNLMGFGAFDSTRWISRDTYSHLLDIRKVGFFQKFLKRILYVGEIFFDQDGNVISVSIDNAYILDEGFITEENFAVSGNFGINVLNNNGAVIFNLSFDPLKVFDEVDTTNTTLPDIAPFAFILPFEDNVSSIQLLEENIVLDELNRTPNTPSLSLISPTGGELVTQQMTIEYDATDADNDTINYAILISSDNGATFTTLAVDHPNKTFFLNTTPFPDDDQYKIKILATDGINTDTVISGTFTINNSLEVIPGIIILKKVKTKCGEGKEKDYIRIRGKMEGFEPASDFNIEIKGNPAIFGPVTVTIPFGTKTVTISEGKVQASFPNDGTGNFHINVDADNLNECPSSTLEANLILSLNGVKKTITLEREKNSKFFSTRNPIGILGLASWWSSITGMVTFIEQYLKNIKY